MRTTDDIIKDLGVRAAAGEDVRQQVISHHALAQLRAELATVDPAVDPDRVRGLRGQINVHRGLVDEDVDEQPPVGDTETGEAAKRPRPAK